MTQQWKKEVKSTSLYGGGYIQDQDIENLDLDFLDEIIAAGLSKGEDSPVDLIFDDMLAPPPPPPPPPQEEMSGNNNMISHNVINEAVSSFHKQYYLVPTDDEDDHSSLHTNVHPEQFDITNFNGSRMVAV